MNCRLSKRRRFVLFLAGLFSAGLGVAVSTRPALGTTPITSLPYVMTFISPWTLGFTTVVFNIIFVVAQMMILRSRYTLKELAQLPTLFAFGFFIDLGMLIASLYTPEHYILRFAVMMAGCLLLALGISLLLIADVSYMPGEGIIKTISREYSLSFSRVKICFDVSTVAMAIILSLVYFHNITGVREGTVVAAFLVGLLIRRLQKPLRPVKKWLYAGC